MPIVCHHQIKKKNKLHCALSSDPGIGLDRNLCVYCKIPRLEAKRRCRHISLQLQLPTFKGGKLDYKHSQWAGATEWSEFREIIYCEAKQQELTIKEFENCQLNNRCDKFADISEPPPQPKEQQPQQQEGQALSDSNINNKGDE